MHRREMCSCLFCKPSLVENVKADQGHFQQWGGKQQGERKRTLHVWPSRCGQPIVKVTYVLYSLLIKVLVFSQDNIYIY